MGNGPRAHHILGTRRAGGGAELRHARHRPELASSRYAAPPDAPLPATGRGRPSDAVRHPISKGAFWRPPLPGSALFWAIVAAQVVAALLRAFGLLVPAISWRLIGFVWVYNLAWMLILDDAKLATYHELAKRAALATPFLARLKAPLQPAGAADQRRPRSSSGGETWITARSFSPRQGKGSG
jgi:hypothetical protein